MLDYDILIAVRRKSINRGVIMQSINLEPKWENLFDTCIAQVKAVVSKEEGQSMIIEILEFGKRLYLARPVDIKAINSEIKKDLKVINDKERIHKCTALCFDHVRKEGKE